ncbi:MAG: molybdopterin-binding protein [Oscillospiraceae bacterium]|nr:molybdopterin-binding protein [Oscillospiraceae bacterium]
MKLIKTEDAVGQVLCHDMTQIIPGQFKGARFRKGHVVMPEDIPVLLSMGKENLYVWELTPGMLHENDGAERLRRLCQGPGMTASEPREGKIELTAQHEGLFLVDVERLYAVNSIEELMIATRKGGTAVRTGDKLCGMRVVPLVIDEAKLDAADRAAGGGPILQLLPWKLRRAGVITTGSEVFHGRVEDHFTPILREKLAAFGIGVTEHTVVDDGMEHLTAAIAAMREKDIDLLLCTGGMSVDPDDNTPGAIRRSGARIVTYGAPVLPGAMLLVGYYEDGLPVLGLPGCVMYAKATIFDLLLPKLAAGVPITRPEILRYGNGGLCLGCEVCRYPVCPFGK